MPKTHTALNRDLRKMPQNKDSDLIVFHKNKDSNLILPMFGCEFVTGN